RRLAVAFSEVAARQPDAVQTHLGPNVRAAYDAEGRPTPAALGFARGKGVDVAALTRETTPKGEVVAARVEMKGRPTAELLSERLPGFIADIPFPKKMRWSDKKLAFARPLHWIVAVFDGKPLNFELGGIACGATSRGHRFLAPGPFEVDGLASYLKGCEAHHVMVDPVARKKAIEDQVRVLQTEAGGEPEVDDQLVDEVNFLVEYPVALRGNFDARFLELPKELLVISMKQHQRYFPVWSKDGSLLPHFITISNMKPQSDEIQAGNERVLRARLEDARFFFKEDRKKKLEEYVGRLKDVVWQKDLGTSFDKMERFSRIACELTARVCPEESARAQRAALLSKADLVTQMVYEFPELQGVMGSYYALASGEDPEVALAIKEHYRPAFAGDAPPLSAAGAAVALADKLDTILGCIGVGLLPSGSEDPYGLRRHALGILQILLARGWRMPLGELIDLGIETLAGKLKRPPEEVRKNTLDLFTQRFKTHLSGEGFPYDAVDAVLATGIDFPGDGVKKVEALSELKKQPYFEALAIAFRRVVSILTAEARGEVDTALFKEKAEGALYEEYQRVRPQVEAHIQRKEFPQALEKIVEIKKPVDDFFDQVMVMVKDDALRKNRLHLLYCISELFSPIADFSRIVVEKGK
ncbi:MAG: glycine--tRNA ligase subunit beta, partial [Nitrospinaceae bacterium]